MVQSVVKYSKQKPTVSVDWFEIFGTIEMQVNSEGNFHFMPEIKQEQQYYDFDDNIGLKLMDTGTPMFLYRWEVYYHGEHFGLMQTHPRRITANSKENTMMFQIANHQLYCAGWITSFTEIAEGLGLGINNVTRLDIAVDGLEHIRKFLNHFQKQPMERKQINMKGRATFNCFKMDHKSLEFDRFQIGSSKSDKAISVYCKTDELEVSNKMYIKKMWIQNGLTNPQIYRFEMRFRSKAIKEIIDFDLTELENTAYLMSLVRTHCENFFHFTQTNGSDSNISRQEDIELIDWNYFNADLLAKSDKPNVDGRYKAKLSIHLVCKLFFTQKLKDDTEKTHSINHACLLIQHFDLFDWVKRKIDQWEAEYYRQGLQGSAKNLLAELSRVEAEKH